MRDLMYVSTPSLWSLHPYLPVIRRSAAGDHQQLGVIYDARGTTGLCGYSSTVLIANIFAMPKTQEELLALPKIVYDSFDELLDDGWVID